MAYLLTAFGHQAIEAHSGAEGIEKARTENPQLVLLDIHMPVMDGYEVARLLRADADCWQIPIVAVTALAMVGDREKILASGFNGYIAKPIDPEAFSIQVNEFLNIERAPAIHRRVHPSAPSQNPAPPGKKLAVVVFVDNMQTNIDLVRNTLEPYGYEVYAALSAHEGFDLALRTKPDLILSDVHMQHHDGYELLRMVQANTSLSSIPFVFMSSSVWSTREQEQALVRGAKRFIARPLDPAELIAEIEQCLAKNRGA